MCDVLTRFEAFADSGVHQIGVIEHVPYSIHCPSEQGPHSYRSGVRTTRSGVGNTWSSLRSALGQSSAQGLKAYIGSTLSNAFRYS